MALVLCLSLCACGKDTPGTSANQNPGGAENTTPSTTQTDPKPLADFDILGEWIIADDGLAVITFKEDGTCIKEGEAAVKYKVEADIAVLTIYYSTPQSYNIEKFGEHYRMTGEHFLLREKDTFEIIKIKDMQDKYDRALAIIENLTFDRYESHPEELCLTFTQNANAAKEAYEILTSINGYKESSMFLSNFSTTWKISNSQYIIDSYGNSVYMFSSSGYLAFNPQYNSNGQLISINQTTNIGNMATASLAYEYDADGNLVLETYQATKYSTHFPSYIVQYSNFVFDEGRLVGKIGTKEYEDDAEDKEITTYSYTYNSEGMLVEERRETEYVWVGDYSYKYATIWKSVIIIYEYDEAGNRISSSTSSTERVSDKQGKDKESTSNNTQTFEYETIYWYSVPEE